MLNVSSNADAIPRRWVVMGVSGCGKSEVGRRLAERLDMLHVEGDTDHPPANIAKMAAGTPLDDNDRRGWLLLLKQRIDGAATKGGSLVLSCSALKRRYRDLLRADDPGLFFLHLKGERELIASRMQKRTNHFMPVTLLDSQFRDLEPLEEDEYGVTVDIRFPPEALVEQVIQRLASGQSGRLGGRGQVG